MSTNFSGSLIGLSLLGGNNFLTSFAAAPLQTAAVIRAKQQFTTPETTPPWREAQPKNVSILKEADAIRRMSSILIGASDNSLSKLPDVQTSFTTYKALDRLRVLADAATKNGTTETERAALQARFEKGMGELRDFLGEAETDLLSLHFGVAARRAQSAGLTVPPVTSKRVGEGVAATRAEAIAGLNGDEVFSVTLKRGATTETVTVDLADTTQPPTLDSVADALNAAIGGGSAYAWKSRFSVEKNDGKWGLAFTGSGAEKASIDQVGANDALMIASGRTDEDKITSAQVFRIGDPTGTMEALRLNTINAVDAKATAAKKPTPPATGASSATEPAKPTSVLAATSARAITTDAQGFSYVVGTTAGDLGNIRSDGKDDLFLTKVDSEGRIMWQRSLGAPGSGEGAAVTLAPNGDIVVAGTVSGAYNGSDDGQTDMLVARFTSSGVNTMSSAIRSLGDQSATAVAVGDDGSIYVGGSNSTNKGDATILRLDAAGKVQERRTIDSGGVDTLTALAMSADGELLAVTRQHGVSTLHKIDGNALATDIATLELGAVDAKAIAVSETGEIAIAGTTSVAVAGDQVNAMAGGSDAFVTRIASDLSGADTTYIGTGEADMADSVVYMNGALYVGGRTSGALDGELKGKTDGFVARIDPGTGNVADVMQWGLRSLTTEPVRLSAAVGGSTALGKLGLARGTLDTPASAPLIGDTALREGDSFKIKVDGGTARTITIDKNESMSTLAEKIQLAIGKKGTATTARLDGKQVLRIDVKSGASIELLAGSDGRDVLSKLGMKQQRLVAPADKPKNAPKVTPGGTFSLSLTDGLSIASKSSAKAVLKVIEDALSMTQTAYRSLYWDAGKEATVNGFTPGNGSAYQQGRLAQYQDALSRLGG